MENSPEHIQLPPLETDFKEKKSVEPKITEEERKEKEKIDEKMREEKIKDSKWTQADLQKLQKDILDTGFGNPRTFRDDWNLIRIQLEKETTKLDTVEKGEITADGADYLFGLFLEAHIFRQGFFIELDKNQQPIICDHSPNPSESREQKRLGLQNAITQIISFGGNLKNITKENDNVSNIATYISALAYHNQPEKNLIKYRENLEEKVQKNPIVPITPEDIKNSGLNGAEKSFLLSWYERNNDRSLVEIQDNQKRFVENARAEKGKSSEQFREELMKAPLSKITQMILPSTIGLGALALGIAGLRSGKGQIIKKILGVVSTLIGAGIMIPIGDKAWGSLGAPDLLSGLDGHKPFDNAEASDNLIPRLGKWLSRASEKKIREKVMPFVSGVYPIGAMIYVLSGKNGKALWSEQKPSPDMEKNLQEIFAKLDREEQKGFKEYLLDKYRDHIKENPNISSQERRTITLNGLLQSKEHPKK